jgi:hypothetical protein
VIGSPWARLLEKQGVHRSGSSSPWSAFHPTRRFAPAALTSGWRPIPAVRMPTGEGGKSNLGGHSLAPRRERFSMPWGADDLVERFAGERYGGSSCENRQSRCTPAVVKPSRSWARVMNQPEEAPKRELESAAHKPGWVRRVDRRQVRVGERSTRHTWVGSHGSETVPQQ